MTPDVLLISAEGMVAAKKLRLEPGDVIEMAGASCRITHEHGNRRYHEFLFRVDGNTVCDVRLLQPIAEQDDGDGFFVTETCEQCDGDGCPACGYEGEVQVRRK